MLPHMSTEQANGPAITIANGPPIPYWGVREHMLKVTVRSYKWTFLLEATTFPILGTHCLQKFDLMVDLKTGRLFKRASPGFINLRPPPVNSVFATIGMQPVAPTPVTANHWRQPASANLPVAAHQHRLYAIGSIKLALQLRPYNIGYTTALYNISGLLQTVGRVSGGANGQPATAMYRRLDAEKQDAAKKEFLELEQQGVLRSWGGPVEVPVMST